MATPVAYGMRLFSGEQRRSLTAIQMFARRVEQLGSGALDTAEKLRRLDTQAEAVERLGGPGGDRIRPGCDPVLVALARAHASCGLPLAALGELIEGARMDARRSSYGSFEELLVYCRRANGSLGRLYLTVHGSREPERAAVFAEDLAVALRLAELVRDLRRDAERGRVYLPAEDFRRYHLLAEAGSMTPAALSVLVATGSKAEPAALTGLDGGPQGQFYALLRFQALRARDWLHRGAGLLELLDRRGVAYVLAITSVYRRLLERIEDRPDRALGGPMALPLGEQAWVASRGLLRRRLPERHPAERLP